MGIFSEFFSGILVYHYPPWPTLRLALGQKRGEIEYEDRLRKLEWPTLETRRLCLSLAELL